MVPCVLASVEMDRVKQPYLCNGRRICEGSPNSTPCPTRRGTGRVTSKIENQKSFLVFEYSSSNRCTASRSFPISLRRLTRDDQNSPGKVVGYTLATAENGWNALLRNALILLARPRRFERPTFAFGGQYPGVARVCWSLAELAFPL